MNNYTMNDIPTDWSGAAMGPYLHLDITYHKMSDNKEWPFPFI